MGVHVPVEPASARQGLSAQEETPAGTNTHAHSANSEARLTDVGRLYVKPS